MKKPSVPAARHWLRSLAALAVLFPLLTSAQVPPPLAATSLFHNDPRPAPSALAAALTHARPLLLDVAQARAVLARAPAEGQAAAPVVLALPLPDGRTGRFALRQTALMAPALAARYPEIGTYAGRGLDDPTATVRLDLTPAGLHAQILSATTGTVYLDPARPGDTRHYLSFFKHAMRPASGWTCSFKREKTPATAAGGTAGVLGAAPGQPGQPAGPAAIASGGALRTYRLCVAATGEYTAFHGGTVAQAQAAIVTSVNRVVGVYEKELAVRLVLVANNDQVIYRNGATDPYDNNDGGAMLDQNQVVIDSVIGSANYDIGHVFSTGGGGVAGYAVVCSPSSKANGVTGSGSPVGDSFDIDYVAHEMGHQFSGSHPFNGSSGACGGNRSPNEAWEPGSGSTIMAYAGICAPQDLQAHSDAVFHVGNFEEMRGFILTTPCATLTATGNTTPLVTGPPSGKIMPIGTPFKLTASASDADGDTLTYHWEELDLGPAGSPTAVQVPDETPPLFRSFVPGNSPTRYFPRLADLVANNAVIGERLPLVNRTLKFKCTARDLHSGPAGVIGGVTSSAAVDLIVTSAAGPFLVSYPNLPTTWVGGTPDSVTWRVAGTTANGVDCALVNLRLSTDGGFTYPTMLAAGVPNSGRATVVVPSVATTQARVLVEAADNYFFDISNADFTISTASVCAAPVAVSIDSLSATTARVRFTATGPAASYLVTTVPATPPQTVTASPVRLTGLAPGVTYSVSIVRTCGPGSTSVAAATTFSTLPVPVCGPPTELVATPVTATSATINFVGGTLAGSYLVSTVPATPPQTVTASPVQLTGLAPATLYTVRIVSLCGTADTSAAVVLAFSTNPLPPANDLCAAALPLVCGVPVTGTTAGATATGDPYASCGPAVDQGGVFYTFTGTGGVITLTTCGPNTNFDTKLFVYQGVCGGPYTCVAGNDDTDAGICQLPSTVDFPSVNGVTYLVFVSGYGNTTGNFGLFAACATPTAAPVALGSAPALHVWPNPIGEQAALHLALAAPAVSAVATLRNVLGQQVVRHAFAGTATGFSTATLAPGAYLLTVEITGQPPVVRRVLVQ